MSQAQSTTHELLPETIAQIDQALNGKKMTITSASFHLKEQSLVEKVLSVFMEKLGKEYLAEFLSYGVRELGINAKRANAKRIYFKEKGLNIHNSTDYQLGMVDFKEHLIKNHKYYIRRLREEGLWVKVELYRREDACFVAVINNARILPWEKLKVKHKLKIAREYTSLEEAYTEVMDDSEGAGLGIIVLLMTLREAGVPVDNFKIFIRGEKTFARIRIPLN